MSPRIEAKAECGLHLVDRPGYGPFWAGFDTPPSAALTPQPLVGPAGGGGLVQLRPRVGFGAAPAAGEKARSPQAAGE